MSKRQRRRVRNRRATGAGVTVGATLLMGGAAQAATLTVGSTDDTTGATDCAVATNNDCTLRDAIEDANVTAASTITFASALSGDTITLGGTELPQITAYSTTIQGPSGGITVDANQLSRVFNVSATDARISGLTVTHGKTAGPGGGIFLQAGQLTLSNAVVTGNTTTGGTGHGAGIYVYSGNLTVKSSTISENHASAYGGGIGTRSQLGTNAGATTIRNSTISGNGAPLFGGGAYLNFQSPATVENSTIYDNYADGAMAVGGGLYHGGQNGGPGLVVTGSTITHNYATARGGGVGSGGTPTIVRPTIRDSIVSANTVGAGGAGPDLSGNTYSMSVSFSLIGTVDSEVAINQIGPNLIGSDPQLGVLADNGGPSETQKPAATSPVIDAGSAFGLTSDQRGQGRPFDAITANALGGDAADIGAVELQVTDIAAAPVPTTPSSPAPTTPTTKKKCKKAKKKHKRAASAKKKGCKKKKKKR